MKGNLLVLLVIALLTTSPSAGAIDVQDPINLSKGQRLACGAILCAVGIAIPESRSECTKVLRDWSIYVATLGPFKSKPKCPIVKNGGAGGSNVMSCRSIADPEYRKMCEDADNGKPQPGYHRCDEYTDGFQRFECENKCDQRYQAPDGGIVCFIE